MHDPRTTTTMTAVHGSDATHVAASVIGSAGVGTSAGGSSMLAVRHLSSISVLFALALLPACSAGDYSRLAEDSGGETGEGTGPNGLGETGAETGDDTDTGDGDGDPGDGDGDPSSDACELACGEGFCVKVGDEPYCECPEGTDWLRDACGACQLLDAAASHELELEIVSFEGQFLLAGAPPPKLEYDDANVWLENHRTGDRAFVGNTHDLSFAVRVTPGIYDVIYEVETPGTLMPQNARAWLGQVALFDPLEAADINIPVASYSGAITLAGAPPPALEYDDANILFRDHGTGNEVVAGNTHDGSYSVRLVPGTYDVVYRVETPGPVIPRNDGAVLETVNVEFSAVDNIDVPSVALEGTFTINSAPAPASEYDDANIVLESQTAGTVALGNTHDGGYALNVIPGSYEMVYMHDTGPNVPQNKRARFGSFDVFAPEVKPIDIEMVQLSGALMINQVAAPASEFDDGVVYLRGVNSDDEVLLGNTHDGAYLVNLMPGTYDTYYSQETSGGTVPDNKHARVSTGTTVVNTGEVEVHDVNVAAVAISGAFTFAGGPPPASDYEDGRIYLRSTTTDDAVLLGNTHDGSYAAVVVPGEYEVFYVQEAGGAVPGNQNAMLQSVSIGMAASYDFDVPIVSLNGKIVVQSGAAPANASDGGQLYLRTPGGDSVLLGESFAAYATNLVAGTYGVYYRSEASVTMPENENGRFACITVE
ncbi:putative hemagglutinin/hemolysin-related protein [Enhygromyxa salina]|uniref:Putative hemagglutinin/hemolysin-related protein n=1 Tax=Enhygromyxa salina TaxID=215803 RepID=A0A0C2D351_9BACT|nr:hypothetical protein [Enhygromyxa salina]KIG17666.1 putative hemagglutinin/hemolysin-related protein [Enhygromyxa salina]